MGAINYGMSDYITIGYNCNNIDYDDNFYYELIQDDFDQVKYILKQYNFNYFDVRLNPGYYEGFYIDIKFNCNCDFYGNDYFYSYEDKQLAQKEITQIKKFLLSCLDFGCCAVYPGWCTGYANYKTTLQEIDAAIQKMRETVKTTPTWARLKKYA